MADTSLSAGMRWSTISVVGREATRTIFTIILARLIGPEDFGIVAQALVYIGLVSLLLDQGFSSALIQRKTVEPRLPGAVVSVNLAVGGALMALTMAIAPLWASFMNTPELTLVLIIFAPCLLIRSAGVTPRAMLIRHMNFRAIAFVDVCSALCGGALGLVVAIGGGGYWSLVVQIVATDVVMVLAYVAFGAGILPNLHLRGVREIAGFSLRAFAAGVLLNSVSRNIDNLLVGKFQGPEALAYYGLAYRLLLLPVQLALSTVSTVLFPVFSRLVDSLDALSAEVARTTRVVAALALPGMALVAAAAPQLVLVLFGEDWSPAIPIIQVLAVAGALQAIYQSTTTPLVLGLGHDRMNLRFAWITTIVTTIGIVSGLPFGPLGVAIGYTAATVVLVPVEWFIRRHLLGTRFADQVTPLLPAVHIALWIVASYLAVAIAIPGHELITLGAGLVVSLAVGGLILRFVHGELLRELIDMSKRLSGRASNTGVEEETANIDDKQE
ncbi:lipopolysaccharide biosynthesis protein [Gordonia sp. CPCC 205515]|uniref:lipopolysaccharide biosynthesis protein n=1 Tax=Gordonia sp. CPCC 205515 TaxID=3140791 RepID=UPI003AF336DE